MKANTLLILGLCLVAAFQIQAADIPQENVLTTEEQTAGWQLLFDGKTLAGWRPYGNPAGEIGKGWKIEKGLLTKVGGQKGGDIITKKKYRDFELAWEWRLTPGANNGVKYLVTEKRPKAPGYEYQMLDDHSDRWNKLPEKEKTASFYSVLPPATNKPLKPAGEWNTSRIIVNGQQVEHWLNGTKVLEYTLGSTAVKEAVQKSKFKKFSDFGDKVEGHIMLTDHQDEATYRNIKIRRLSASK